MKLVLRRIDRAIKRLYNLDFAPSVERFLVSVPGSKRPGALLLSKQGEEDLEMGIHLSAKILRSIQQFPKGRWGEWPMEKLQAFSVVTEEVSHFHYVRYHATQGRQISQLELELQGDIDKFLIAYFTNPHPSSEAGFEQLFEQFFSKFKLRPGLTMEEEQRYVEANRLARRYILKLASQLQDPRGREDLLRRLRKFYRLSAAEKISNIAA